MGVERIKERLHLRIEQADEQMLQVLVEMTESLFRTYQPQILKEKEADLNKDIDKESKKTRRTP